MSKVCRSEANGVAMKIKSNKARWYVADVNLEDDSEDVFACAAAARKILGKTESTFMVISAGVKNLTVVAQCSNTDEMVTLRNWLEYSISNIPVGEIIKRSDHTNTELNNVGVTIEIDTPFKLKDIVRSSAFKFLKDTGCIQEESEEEEYGLEDF